MVELLQQSCARAQIPALVGPNGERLPLPASVSTLLTQLVQELARGRAVTIIPVDAELTTQQAADVLNISRPYLMKLLEAGEIPYRKVGTHRRVKIQDLMAYRQRRSQVRREAFATMAQDAQRLGLLDRDSE
ncbi:MAG: helix-turn-helix domain-containing protein [Chloroflexi bacterium]|nr:helix-turn-helix domain-containing protein [Chloroflexota bacterium]